MAKKRNPSIREQLRQNFATPHSEENIEFLNKFNTDKTVKDDEITNDMEEKSSLLRDKSVEYITIKKGGRPPIGEEKRSKKITLLLTPSLYHQLRETAFDNRSSINDYIFHLIEENMSKSNK